MPELTAVRQELQERLQQQAVVAELGQLALRQDIGLSPLIATAVTKLSDTLGAEFCKVLELDPDGKSLLLRAGVGWKEGCVGQARVPAEHNSQAGYTLRSTKPVIVTNLSEEQRFHEPALLLDHGVVSGMSVVIDGRERPYGVVGVHTARQRTFTEHDITFLQSVANVLAEAIERHNAEQKLKAINAELEARILEGAGHIRLLQLAAVAANEATHVEQALAFVIRHICRFLDWPIGHAWLISKDGTRLTPSGIWHLANESRFADFRTVTESISFMADEGLPGRVLAGKKPAWVGDLKADYDFLRARLIEDTGVHTGFAFPVLLGGEVTAVLEFYTDKTQTPNQSLLKVMAQIGAQLGRVVERQQAEAALRKSERQLAEAQSIAHIGSWEWDIISGALHWSEELYRIYGQDPQTFTPTYESFLQCLPPADQQLAQETITRSLQTHDSFEFEHRVIRPDGSTRVLQGRGRVVADDVGRPIRMVGTGQDITERRHMEGELTEARQQLDKSREAERLHLARELHDGPIQDLYGLDFHLQALGEMGREERLRHLRHMHANIHKIATALRELCRDLRPPTLDPFGLSVAIQSHVDRYREKHPDVAVNLDLARDQQELPDWVRLSLFRIFQQALDNIYQHAEASTINVYLGLTETSIVLEVEDDGRGFEAPRKWLSLARRGRLGLLGIAERTADLGGSFSVDSTPGTGTRLRVVVPRAQTAVSTEEE